MKQCPLNTVLALREQIRPTSFQVRQAEGKFYVLKICLKNVRRGGFQESVNHNIVALPSLGFSLLHYFLLDSVLQDQWYVYSGLSVFGGRYQRQGRRLQPCASSCAFSAQDCSQLGQFRVLPSTLFSALCVEGQQSGQHSLVCRIGGRARGVLDWSLC